MVSQIIVYTSSFNYKLHNRVETHSISLSLFLFAVGTSNPLQNSSYKSSKMIRNALKQSSRTIGAVSISSKVGNVSLTKRFSVDSKNYQFPCFSALLLLKTLIAHCEDVAK